MSFYLAVDLGTTGCRSVLFDEKLQQKADSYREYGLITEREKWAEQDADLWWSLTLETAEEAISKAGIRGSEVDGIGVSSQGITIVPVNERFEPLCNAISWLDTRAEKQAERLKEEIGLRKMFILTGKRIDPVYSLPKILWLKEEKPEVFEKVWKFLMPMDFLIGKLTGRCVTDHTMASGTLLYDIKNKIWNKKILDLCGLNEEQLPRILWSGEAVGPVLPKVAKKLGLRPDCIVAVGAQDQRCASLGVGIQEGVMTVSLGTAGAISKLWKEADTEGDMRIGWSAYVNENTWVTEGVINTAAVCLRWLRDIMFPGCGYDIINEEAERAMKRDSELLFYPYLGGPSSPDNYPDSQGCFYGVNLATQRGDFALAVMEGIAFQIRIILEAMEADDNVNTLVLFGGGSKSQCWCQIIADVTGMRIIVPDTAEAACAGAAILAGIGNGEFDRRNPPRISYTGEYTLGHRAQSYVGKYQKFRAIEKQLWEKRIEHDDVY